MSVQRQSSSSTPTDPPDIQPSLHPDGDRLSIRNLSLPPEGRTLVIHVTWTAGQLTLASSVIERLR